LGGEVKETVINLVREESVYAEILKRAIEIEENPPDDFISMYGWVWHQVQALPLHLTSLLKERVLRVGYKSCRYIHYKLTDLKQTKEALKELGYLD